MIALDEQLHLTLRYLPDFFDADYATALLDRVLRLLSSVATDPSVRVGDVDIWILLSVRWCSRGGMIRLVRLRVCRCWMGLLRRWRRLRMR